MINNPRIYLWVALGLLLLLNYQTWMVDYGPRPLPPGAPAAEHRAAHGDTSADLGSRVPEVALPAPASGAAPAGATAPAAAASGATASAASAAQSGAAAPLVHVRTDVLDVEISTRGGTLQQVDLPAYPKVKGKPEPVRLENQDSPETLYDLQSGLAGPGSGPYPTHLASFASERSEYTTRGRERAVRTAHLERAQRRHGDQDLRIPARRVPHRRRIPGAQRKQRAVARVLLRADPA